MDGRTGASLRLITLTALLFIAHRASADPLPQTIVGGVPYIIRGKVAGRDRRISLSDITEMTVRKDDGRLATRIRISLIDGRSLEVTSPTITMGPGWRSNQRNYERERSGAITLSFARATTIEGLLDFLQDGDARARLGTVKADRMEAVSRRRLEEAIERAGRPAAGKRVKTSDLLAELRGAMDQMNRLPAAGSNAEVSKLLADARRSSTTLERAVARDRLDSASIAAVGAIGNWNAGEPDLDREPFESLDVAVEEAERILTRTEARRFVASARAVVQGAIEEHLATATTRARRAMSSADDDASEEAAVAHLDRTIALASELGLAGDHAGVREAAEVLSKVAGTRRNRELARARDSFVTLLRGDGPVAPAKLREAAARYRQAGGTNRALAKLDRKLAARYRALNIEHRRAAAKRPFAEIPEELEPFVARDLTALAASGKLDEVVGRDRELRRVSQALNRRTKRNVFLTGEPGVGKSALVEGLAIKIARGDLDLPDGLQGKAVLEISLTNLISGTRYRGDLEERVQQMIAKVTAMPEADRPILFIDEGHTIVGGGSAEGGLDIGNMLKPALARGELQVISATTSSEYDRFVDRDKALGRRFSPVFIPEPSPEQATRMLRSRVKYNERHYKVKIDRSAVRAAVDLSVRYLPARMLPDKSQDVLEEAASRAATRRAGRVTARDVRDVVEEWSGVPIRTGRAETAMLLDLEKRLGKRVFGQDEAISELSDAYRQLRAKMKSGKNKRPANLMFLGPTGTGKTELAKAFASDVFGDEAAMTRIDMSEFQEKHSVSRLIGSPNGYVDSDEQGLLTKAVRRRPFQVLVLDEIEKAHPDVQNLLLQILDDGRLSDRFGTVDFSNTVIIMTSNALTGTPRARAKIGFEANGRSDDAGDGEVDKKVLRGALIEAGLRPEFVNRVDSTVLFKPHDRTSLGSIVRNLVHEEGRQYGVKLTATPEAEAELIRRGYNPELGARPLRRAVQKAGSPLAKAMLTANASQSGEYQLDASGGQLKVTAVGKAASRTGKVNPKLRKRLEARRAGGARR